MARLARNLSILFICLGLLALSGVVLRIEQRLPEHGYSRLAADLQAGRLVSLDVTGSRVCATDQKDYSYCALVVTPAEVVPEAARQGIKVTVHSDYTSYYFQAGFGGFALLLILVVWLSLAGRRREDPAGEFARGKKVSGAASEVITFANVAGVPEAKEELEEVVTFLKNPQQFRRLGAVMPRGLLLQGPPGTGKTLLARAIAGEAGVPFYSFSGSDFVEMFVGVGASRVRDLFREAKQNAPCIIFIDEIDAVGSKRKSTTSDGQDERGQTLNALLVEMDGFEPTDNIIVLAATNRPDILDPALSRPGRFDRRITLLPPDIKGRIKILSVHSKRVVLSEEVDLEEIAQMTSGFTGAELANLVNEAALLAGRDGSEAIRRTHFDQARDRIMLGVVQKGVVLTEKDKLILAYHEAGHAIVAKMLPDSDPVHKITIIPRGRALGQTQQLPLGERTAYSREYLTNRITILLGGRAAEKVVFNRRTTRTENDLLQATEIATNMVCRWGMSESLGPQAYALTSSSFLGEEDSQRLVMGSDTARLIDREIKTLLSTCYKRAVEILEHERLFLKTLSEILFQVETLDAEEFEIIYRCSVTMKAQEAGLLEKESECSVCPARDNCTQVAY